MIFTRPVGHPYLPLRVAQQAIREVEFLGEFGVLLHGVEGRPQDHDLSPLELRRQVAVPATLDGSAGRIGLRKEPQYDGPSREITEGDVLPPVVLDLEIGRLDRKSTRLNSSH